MMKLFSLIVLALALALSGCGKKSAGSHEQATMDELNRIVSSITMQNGGRVDTNQVASFLAAQGKSFPVPPAGKKLFLNPTRHQFEFVDQ
jgi:ABC-type glycerol-3-phosphate transport system substrate-binding protein